jgi:acetyl-CoA C-acetyltransferase
MNDFVIVSGVRIPMGAHGGSLCDMNVAEFTAVAFNEEIDRARIEPEQVDDVIMGQAYQNGACANGARMALLQAGWPNTVPGVTLDRRCCSGLDAIF